MKKHAVTALLMLAASAATAAVVDNYGTSRVDSIAIQCESVGVAPCIVEVRRFRAPTAQARTEAQSVGFEIPDLVERVTLRQVTRANLNTFLTTTTTPYP